VGGVIQSVTLSDVMPPVIEILAGVSYGEDSRFTLAGGESFDPEEVSVPLDSSIEDNDGVVVDSTVTVVFGPHLNEGWRWSERVELIGDRFRKDVGRLSVGEEESPSIDVERGGGCFHYGSETNQYDSLVSDSLLAAPFI